MNSTGLIAKCCGVMNGDGHAGDCQRKTIYGWFQKYITEQQFENCGSMAIAILLMIGFGYIIKVLNQPVFDLVVYTNQGSAVIGYPGSHNIIH